MLSASVGVGAITHRMQYTLYIGGTAIVSFFITTEYIVRFSLALFIKVTFQFVGSFVRQLDTAVFFGGRLPLGSPTAGM